MANEDLIAQALLAQRQGQMSHQPGTGRDPSQIVDRAAILPLGRDQYGNLKLAVPGSIQSVADAVQAIGSGQSPMERGDSGMMQPSQEAIGQAMDVAGGLTLGAGAIPAQGLRAGASLVGRRPQAAPSRAGLPELPPVQQGPSMYDLPPGTDPRYLGAAPDRTDLSYVRYAPKNQTPRMQSSLEAMRDPNNPVRQQMLKDIRAGESVGGNDWYNTEEMRDWFIKELGEAQGHREWAQFMDLMGASSPGSKVDANIGNASAMRRMALQGADEIIPGRNITYREAGIPNPNNEYLQQQMAVGGLEDARALGSARPEGYGHKTQALQELVGARQAQGNWSGAPEMGVPPAKGNWTENPKPKGFAQSLKGSNRNIAADLHFTRYMAMASRDPRWLGTSADVSQEFASSLLKKYPEAKKYFGERNVNGKMVPTFNPKKAVTEGGVPLDDIADYPSIWEQNPNAAEYGDFEKFMGEIARELGQTPAQVQANLWMGAAKRTGVDDSSQGTFMELLRKRADKRAQKEGMTREEVMRRFIKEAGLLTPPVVPVSPFERNQGYLADGGLT